MFNIELMNASTNIIQHSKFLNWLQKYYLSIDNYPPYPFYYKLKPNASTRNFAICARITLLTGQYIRGVVWQPEVIPAVYRASMYEQKILVDGTSVKTPTHEEREQEPGLTVFMLLHRNFAIACR